MTVTLREPMSKKRTAPESGGGKTTMKVADDIARKAKIVAAIRELDLFDYIESILRPAVERDHAQALREEAEKGKEGGKGNPTS